MKPALLVALLSLTLAPAASAHVQRTSGPYRMTLGWADEPALSGERNFIEVTLARVSGAPVPARAGKLQADVSFGPARTTLALEPGGGPGKLRAPIEPTRPGTYSFHVTGTVAGRGVDVAATCSPTTFDCVTDAGAIQFPTREPSPGEIVQRVARGLPRAERAADTAASAHTIAIVALALAAAGLAIALSGRMRARRRGG